MFVIGVGTGKRERQDGNIYPSPNQGHLSSRKSSGARSLFIIMTLLALFTVVSLNEASAEMESFVISSGSMEPTLQFNDVVIVDTNVSFEELRVGDIIVFNKPGPEERFIVSRVFEVGFDREDGTRIITTKGDANPEPTIGTDTGIRESDYVGKEVQFRPGVGVIPKIFSPPVSWYVLFGIAGTMIYFVGREQHTGVKNSHDHIQIVQRWYWELPAFVLMGALLYIIAVMATQWYVGFAFTVMVVGVVMYRWYKRKRDDKDSDEKRVASRPVGLRVVGIFTFVLGLIALVWGTLIIALPSFYLRTMTGAGMEIDDSNLNTLFLILDGTSIQALGISQIVAAIGTWRRKGWAWTSNVVSSITGIIIALLEGRSISLMVVYLSLLLLLLSPLIRSYFGKYESGIPQKKGWRSLFVMQERKAAQYIRNAWIAGLIYGMLLAGIAGVFLVFDSPDVATMPIVASMVVFGLTFGLSRKRLLPAITLLAFLVLNSFFLVWESFSLLGVEAFWFFSTELLGIPIFQGLRATLALHSISNQNYKNQ
jgi:signal peptidase I